MAVAAAGLSAAPALPLAAARTTVSAWRWGASLFAHVALAALAFWLPTFATGAVTLVAAALLAAFAIVQVGYHSHDLDHGQVALGPRSRRLFGLLCWNLLLGVSASWWRDKHGRHHRETHVIGRDPDLYDLFAYDDAQVARRGRLGRWLAAHQHRFFWLATSLARAYYNVFSLLHALRLPRGRRAAEVSLLLAHHAGMIAAAWLLMGWRALPFLLLAQLFSGLYMGLVFAINHLGMPHPQVAGEGRWWQVEHTRNVTGGALADYLFGGLNLQIEHHLHPNYARRALREIQPATEQACRGAGIRYEQVGLLRALADVQRSLRQVASGAARP